MNYQKVVQTVFCFVPLVRFFVLRRYVPAFYLILLLGCRPILTVAHPSGSHDLLLPDWFSIRLDLNERPDTGPGRLYVIDVYHGTEGIPAGTIRFLNLTVAPVEGAGSSSEAGCPVGKRGASPDRVLGRVPVASDGSAYFVVPADTSLCLAATDETGRIVAFSREAIRVPADRLLGRIGLNDRADETPPNVTHVLYALMNDPATPVPEP